MRILKYLALVLCFTAGAAEAKDSSEWGGGALLANSMKAPDIKLVSLTNGTSERLSDYAGKVVVLEFWATWCGLCQKNMAAFQNYFEKYPDWKDKVVLIAASVDRNESAATKQLKANGWDRTHNVWVGSSAKDAYHVSGVPTAYVIDRQGKITAGDPADIPAIVNHEIH